MVYDHHRGRLHRNGGWGMERYRSERSVMQGRQCKVEEQCTHVDPEDRFRSDQTGERRGRGGSKV